MKGYTVSIRTLGRVPELLLGTLDSVFSQTVPPGSVRVYIPYGFDMPAHSYGDRVTVVRCQRGMVSQRSQSVEDIDTDYILFLDDDVAFGPDTVARLIATAGRHNADAVCPDTFRHDLHRKKDRFVMAMMGTHSHRSSKVCFRILRDSNYSFYRGIGKNVEALPTQSASWPVALVRTDAHRTVHFENEQWFDAVGYTLGDDQLYFYKLHRLGFKVFIDPAIRVDNNDGANVVGTELRSARDLAKCRYLVWHRSILSPTKSKWKRLCLTTYFWLSMSRYFATGLALKLKFRHLSWPSQMWHGLHDGRRFTRTSAYRQLPPYLTTDTKDENRRNI